MNRPEPLKPFFLAALLWLPMAFFLWFYFASVMAWPAAQLLGPLLVAVLPEVFTGAEQFQFAIEVQTRLVTISEGRVGLLELRINPMIYGYGLPLLAGLTMATPLSGWRRASNIGIGFIVITAIMLWGSFWQVIKHLRFGLGPQGLEALEGTIFINEALVGLCYQFGYLILPPVTPIALWIWLNRRYVERLVGVELQIASAGRQDQGDRP